MNLKKEKATQLQSNIRKHFQMKKTPSPQSGEGLKNPKEKNKKQKIKANKSIQRKLVVYFALFAFIPVLITSLISSVLATKTVENTSASFAKELLKQSTQNIDNLIESAQSSVINLIADTEFNANAETFLTSTAYEKNQLQRVLTKKIASALLVNDNIEALAYISEDGKTITREMTLTDQDIELIKAQEGTAMGVWVKGFDEDSEGLYYIKDCNGIKAKKRIGWFICKLKLSTLESMVSDVKVLKGSEFYITTANKQMIYTSQEADQNLLSQINFSDASGSLNYAKQMVFYETMTTDWKLSLIIPKSVLTEDIRNSTILIAFIAIIFSIVAAAIGVVLAKHFSKPIIHLVSLMKQAEQGDMTVRTKMQGREDEIGLVCISFDVMMTKIGELIQEAKNVIDKTLKQNVVLIEVTTSLTDNFERLNESIQGIAVGSTQQAEDTENASMAMHKLSGSIGQVQAGINTVVEHNQNTENNIQSINKDITNLKQAINEMLQFSTEVEGNMNSLENSMKSIKDIMEILDEISEQTNLLALNASIEAARAGEAGKGFAVVAQEIRHLSEQSQDSTQKIRETLDDIKNQTVEAVKATQKSSEAAKIQSQVIEDTCGAFERAILFLKNLKETVAAIDGQIIQMEEAKEKTVVQMENISSVTEETASTTQEVSALSMQQKEVVSRLEEITKNLADNMKKLEFAMTQFKA